MRSNAWPEYALALLAACSLEAAWITVAYVAVGSLVPGGFTPLPIIAVAGAVLLGLGFARWSARDPRRSYRTPVAGIALAAALVGWLLPLGPAAAQVLQEPLVVIGMHPGGILLGLAVLRGTAHVTPDDDERIAEVALGPGLVAIAAIWLLLTATGATLVPSVVDAAFAATVTFVTAGLLSIGLARLTGLRSTGVIGADRRSWIGVLVGVVVGLLAVAMPLALILGVPLDAAIRGVLGPVSVVLVAVVTLLAWPAALLGTLLVLLIEALRGNVPTVISDPAGPEGTVGIDWQNLLGSVDRYGLVLGLIPLIVAIVVAFLVVRALLGRPGPSAVEGDLVEVRQSERPTGGVRLRRPHLPMPRRHPDPRTASEAYLASLEVLAQSHESARRDAETPAEHARRLRADPIGLPLSRLAADYALAEFGRRTLAPSEHRRAVERWRHLRSVGGR